MARTYRAATKRRRGSIAGQPVAVFAIGVALAVSAFVADKYVAANRHTAAKAAAAGSSDQEIYTGSILYMPDDGRVCRQLLFDNRGGNVIDNGAVDCQKAAYVSSLDVPPQWSTARLHVISTGFFRQ